MFELYSSVVFKVVVPRPPKIKPCALVPIPAEFLFDAKVADELDQVTPSYSLLY